MISEIAEEIKSQFTLQGTSFCGSKWRLGLLLFCSLGSISCWLCCSTGDCVFLFTLLQFLHSCICYLFSWWLCKFMPLYNTSTSKYAMIRTNLVRFLSSEWKDIGFWRHQLKIGFKVVILLYNFFLFVLQIDSCSFEALLERLHY